MSSVQVCMDSSTKWQPSMMQERGLKAQEDMLSCSRPLLERRPVKQQTDQQALKCPRCDSTNTKFCYYNNYSLSQPRHFCKTCRRYWTRGGALRNVPVGGGCRKNKRTKRSGIDIHSGVAASTSTSALTPSSTDLVVTNPLMHQTPTSSMHYGLPSSGNDINMIFARIQQAARLSDRYSNNNNGNLGLGQSSFMPSNLVSSLLSNSHSAALKSSFSGGEFPGSVSARHDQGNEDFYSFLEANPHIQVPPTNLGMFTVPTTADGMQNNTDSAIPWTRLSHPPRIPLPFLQEEQQLQTPNSEGQALGPFNCEQHIMDKPKVKMEEPDHNRLVSEWQMVPTTTENLFHTGGDNPDYWNGSSWPDLIGSSSSPLV